jgi:hypothetical protein
MRAILDGGGYVLWISFNSAHCGIHVNEAMKRDFITAEEIIAFGNRTNVVYRVEWGRIFDPPTIRQFFEALINAELGVDVSPYLCINGKCRTRHGHVLNCVIRAAVRYKPGDYCIILRIDP